MRARARAGLGHAARRAGLALGSAEGHGRRDGGLPPARQRRRLPAELVLAGPNVTGVSDDPEGAPVYDEVVEAWRGLPARGPQPGPSRLPAHADVQENAAIVNALQRHASVIVQKSLREGFGLVVTEAMWKGRPVIASAVGGILDQIEDGVSGVLLQDPRDPFEFSRALQGLLSDPARAQRLGRAARERVLERFLGLRHLRQYHELLATLDGAA